MLFSGLLYKCGGCNVTYYGKTKLCFKVWICEYLGISHLTGKKVKTDNNKLTAIQEHLLCVNYSPFFEDFSILNRKSYDFKLTILESPLIARHKPVLNKVDSSLPLELFWYNIIGYHVMLYPSNDIYLFHCAYPVVVCLVFNIMLRALYFIKNRIYEHLIWF